MPYSPKSIMANAGIKQKIVLHSQKNHSCPKSVLKKAGGREAKLRRKKKTKMEIEFWGASY
jgi:hypothetical protein